LNARRTAHSCSSFKRRIRCVVRSSSSIVIRRLITNWGKNLRKMTCLHPRTRVIAAKYPAADLYDTNHTWHQHRLPCNVRGGNVWLHGRRRNKAVRRPRPQRSADLDIEQRESGACEQGNIVQTIRCPVCKIGRMRIPVGWPQPLENRASKRKGLRAVFNDSAISLFVAPSAATETMQACKTRHAGVRLPRARRFSVFHSSFVPRSVERVSRASFLRRQMGWVCALTGSKIRYASSFTRSFKRNQTKA
jgi:hypothetical protein